MFERDEKAGICITLGVLAVIILFWGVEAYTTTYQFSSVTPLMNGPGTVVYHLTDGKTLNFSNAWTADFPAGNKTEMAAGGYIVVSYSVIGYPVSVNYKPWRYSHVRQTRPNQKGDKGIEPERLRARRGPAGYGSGPES